MTRTTPQGSLGILQCVMTLIESESTGVENTAKGMALPAPLS